jgi:hypothetical protein
LQVKLLDCFRSEPKTLEYIQSSLRSATDIVKQGGHVTMKFRDQLFRLHFDNRRVLLWETTVPSTIEKLVDSRPLDNTSEGENLRCISRMYKTKLYGKYNTVTRPNKYKNPGEIAVRHFLKGLLSSPPKFNLQTDAFCSYKDIIEFIKEYNPSIKFSANSLSLYKTRNVKMTKLNKTKESEALVRYVKGRFEDFDELSFYKD